jgi:acylphosphatase
MIVGRHAEYRGRVQGVGFRHTVHRLARGYPVSGFVRNLPGGEVELVVEGPPASVDDFLGLIAKRLTEHIESCTINERQPEGLMGFEIRA